MNRSIMWAQVNGPGLEQLHLAQYKDEIIADGMILRPSPPMPSRLHYTIRCDTNWITRRVSLHVVALAEYRERLTADGAGHWFKLSGRQVTALDGCLDVDIADTPFTNTLAIRRLGLQPGESARISVTYYQFYFKPAWQHYTCLELTPEGGRYRYEGLDTGFTAEITVDADGLVIDYPGIWRRV